MSDWTLAIDFGTTFTVAAVIKDDGRPEVLEIDGFKRLPSLIFLDKDGRLLAGRPAWVEARMDPARVERTPKRYVGRIEDLLLGGEPVRVVDMVATILGTVVDNARRINGGEPSSVVLTHPARWEDRPLTCLADAAQIAGLPNPLLVPEPVAAAFYYAGTTIASGDCVAVYDLGGGTFDTAVLRRAETGGFELIGAPGGDPNLGGEEFDDQLYQYVGERIAEVDEDSWEKLSDPMADRPARAHNATLRDNVREAKESLAEYTQANVYVPLADRDLQVTRQELEQLISEGIADSIDELERTISAANLAIDQVSAVYLVGGSSRILLVSNLIHERFKRPPITYDDPKLVVALGATMVARQQAHTESPEARQWETSTQGPSADQIAQLVANIVELGDVSGHQATAQYLREELQRPHATTTTVVGVGETKRGKSSMLNGLVGHRGLLPVDADVATSVHLSIRYAPEPSAIVFSDDAPEGVAVALDDVATYASVAGNPDNIRGVRAVEIGLDHPLLRRGLSCIDTPGVGGLEAGHTDITMATLSVADALLFVVDASAPLTAPELRFLVRATERIDTVIFVLTKIDAHPSWETIMADDRALIAEHAPRYAASPFLPVSSVVKAEADDCAAEGDAELARELREESGFVALEDVLISNVIERSETLRLLNIVRLASTVLSRVRETEEIRSQSAKGDPQLQEKLEKERERLTDTLAATAPWRHDLDAALKELNLRLESESSKATSLFAQQCKSRLETDPRYLEVIERDIGDAIQGRWMDTNWSLQAGVSAVASRISDQLTATHPGVDFDVQPFSQLGDPTTSFTNRTGPSLNVATPALATQSGIGAGVKGAAWATALLLDPTFGVLTLSAFVGSRILQNQRLKQQKLQQHAEAWPAVQQLIDAGAQEMRTRLSIHLQKARSHLEETIVHQLEQRKQELDQLLHEHQTRSGMSEADRARESAQAEENLRRLATLEASIPTIRTELEQARTGRQHSTANS